MNAYEKRKAERAAKSRAQRRERQEQRKMAQMVLSTPFLDAYRRYYLKTPFVEIKGGFIYVEDKRYTTEQIRNWTRDLEARLHERAMGG